MPLIARLLVFSCLTAFTLVAQDTRARVQGTVTDSTGAVIVQAAVTLINPETGVRSSQVTSATGTYLFDLVTPVRWRIPAGYDVDSGSGASNTLVESYRNHGDNPVGVTVVETARPPGPVGRPAPGFGIGASPREYARWVAEDA